jgi:ubiquinone biosynthesis monooxygenase Coq7
MLRQLSAIDSFIIEADKAIRTVIGEPKTTQRPFPDSEVDEPILSDDEKRLSSRLMRVNHAGEVSAQALYQGQALTANLAEVRLSMQQAAHEENDHLVWCERRISSLGSHTSVLNPLWYLGSFTIGAAAGKLGDKWSLGFVAETEQQVVKHLDEHLKLIAQNDTKSRLIIEQMKIDESEHGSTAIEAGGAELPAPVKVVMGLISKVMTKTSYWL